MHGWSRSISSLGYGIIRTRAHTYVPGIQGPEGTPYEAGVFRLELELSERCVRGL